MWAEFGSTCSVTGWASSTTDKVSNLAYTEAFAATVPTFLIAATYTDQTPEHIAGYPPWGAMIFDLLATRNSVVQWANVSAGQTVRASMIYANPISTLNSAIFGITC
jgi:hypothetical protein